MVKKCAICNEKIEEEHEKLKGTILKVKGVDKKNEFIYVCSVCQKTKDWKDNAMIKGA